MKRVFRSFLLTGGLLTFLVTQAFAQDHPGYSNLIPGSPGKLFGMAGLIPEKEVPVDILQLDVPEKATTGQAVSMTALANVETASLPIESVWQLGDGESKKGLSINHRYDRAGVYTVSVTVHNRFGSARRTRQITVAANPDSNPEKTGSIPAE